VEQNRPSLCKSRRVSWCGEGRTLKAMTLKLFEAGESVLRRTARALTAEQILSEEIQDLIAAMYETMRAAPGVGLAAPQIGLDLQLAVIEDRAEYMAKLTAEQITERMREPVGAHVIINPVLELSGSAGEVEFFEGCLSLPGFTAIVGRAAEVRVRCLNERAEPVTIDARGWYARILQHEIDHLHGTMYVDRMLTRTFMGRENFERYWSGVPVGVARKALCG
jgi:peptide deformylase